MTKYPSQSDLDELRKAEESATSSPWSGDEYEITAPQAPTIFKGNKKLVLADDFHMSEEDGKLVILSRNLCKPMLDLIDLQARQIEVMRGALMGGANTGGVFWRENALDATDRMERE